MQEKYVYYLDNDIQTTNKNEFWRSRYTKLILYKAKLHFESASISLKLIKKITTRDQSS